MNICMFTNTYLPHVGGVARSVNIFAQDLRKAGNRALIIAPVYPDHEDHDQEEADIFRVPAIQDFNGSDFSMRIPAPFYIDEKIDEFRPDVIHSHHPYLLGDAALRAAGRRRLPLIFTHHTLYEEYTHYVTGDSENMQRFAAILSTKYANMCNRVVAPSQSIADLIRKRGVKTEITEIPTGVDVNFFSSGDGDAFRKARDIPDAAFVIGHLGRLAPEKNLAYLAEAVSQAMKDLPEAVFLVAGDGPSKADIRAAFEEKGIGNRLVLPGGVTGADLAGAYAAMDMFVFASHTETQGMVLTEAMAAGNPVIALDAPGAREVVRDGVNGRLLAGDASEARFSSAIRAAAESPDLLSGWRAATRETAASFSRETCAEKLLRLYESVIDQNGGRPEAASLNMAPWDAFLALIQTEWDLIAQKAETVAQTIRKNRHADGSEA